MSRHIFISYRRTDSEGYAGRLFDRLSSHFGVRNIFMDVAAIEAGVDFAREIEQVLVIDRQIGDRHGEGNVLFNMGLALYELEEKDRAIHLVKDGLEIYEAIESPDTKDARKKLKEWGV
jgi:hypothetical protein